MKKAMAGMGVLLLAWGQPGHTAGFAVLEQSAKRMGNAYAGGGAVADEAASVWYNPAAATRVGRELQLGLHYIQPSFEFTGPADTVPADDPLVLSSRERDNGANSATVPNVAYSALVRENWYAGFTLNVPFGLGTEYRDNWIGRYEALESEISSINLNPFVAFELNDQWSFGLGLNINYTEVILASAIDFAGVCAQLTGGVCPNGALPSAGQFDGHVETDGSDVGTGYNFGVMWSPEYSTRVSLAYRSTIDLELNGEGDFSEPVSRGGFAALGPELGGGLAATFSDSDAEADLTLPDTWSLSLYQLITDRTAVLADATWTGWSNVDAIVIDFENPLTPTAVEPLGWEDTWRYSLGLSHSPNDEWTLRTGVAFDESPVPNARLRTPRLPDNDRTWLAVGATRELSQNVSLDVSYSHVFIDDTDIEWESSLGQTISGEYESEGDNVSIALNLRF